MDVVAVLEEQHDDIGRRLDVAATASRAPSRERLVDAAVRRVRAHVVAERIHLYRACRARFPARTDELRVAVAAHERACRAVARLAAVTAADADFEARLLRLREHFRTHARAEEGRLLQRAKTLLGDDDLDAIGDAIASSYRVLVAGGPWLGR